MPLTYTKCDNAKAKDKPYKLSDQGGLYLQVMPNEKKYWRYKYRYQGKQKTLALGVFPEIKLHEAREMHRAAHKQVSLGIDPLKAKEEQARLAKLDESNTFELVAREWHKHNRERWTANHANTIIRRLETFLFPLIGKKAISQLSRFDLINALHEIEGRKAFEVARRSLQTTSLILQYAYQKGYRDEEDFTPNLRKGVLQPVKRTNFAAMETRDLPEFIRKLERNEARVFPQTRLAVELMMLTFVRTGELIKAKWSEFDLDEAMWTIPAERMKMRRPHLTPLSRQSIAILKELKAMNPNREYVFPSLKNPRSHMSNGTILMVLDRMGYRGTHTGHGFRALAMSTIKEKLGYRHEVVDRQLAHAPGNQVDRAYDRAKFLPDRIKMMQEWADYIDSFKTNVDNNNVTPSATFVDK